MSTGAILVSGGSRGLGLAVVRHLLEGGHVVAAFARQASPEIHELQQRAGSNFLFAELDARDADATGAFVAAVEERFGGLAGLVNNAALGQDSLLAHTSPDIIGEIVAVNLLAPILLTRLVVRRMLLQPGGGRIITIGSICGQRGYSGLSVYAATKAAVEGFTRALAREVGGRNILVNAIAPGFFESEMSSVLDPGDLATIRRRTPTGRLVSVADILPVLDMLLFEETNMTGQTVVIDGGASC